MDERGGRTGIPSRFAIYAIPSLLAFVAVFQVILAFSADLTPWKGGGFGMFSTVDSGGSRQLSVRLLVNDLEIPVQFTDRGDLHSLCKRLPTEGNLEAYGKWLARQLWITRDPEKLRAALQQPQADRRREVSAVQWRPWLGRGPLPREPLRITGIEVDVRRPSYDGATARFALGELRQVRVDAPALETLDSYRGIDKSYLRAFE